MIESFYPKAKHTVYEESAQLPMIDETQKWIAEMRSFLSSEAKPPKKP